MATKLNETERSEFISKLIDTVLPQCKDLSMNQLLGDGIVEGLKEGIVEYLMTEQKEYLSEWINSKMKIYRDAGISGKISDLWLDQIESILGVIEGEIVNKRPDGIVIRGLVVGDDNIPLIPRIPVSRKSLDDQVEILMDKKNGSNNIDPEMIKGLFQSPKSFWILDIDLGEKFRGKSPQFALNVIATEHPKFVQYFRKLSSMTDETDKTNEAQEEKKENQPSFAIMPNRTGLTIEEVISLAIQQGNLDYGMYAIASETVDGKIPCLKLIDGVPTLFAVDKDNQDENCQTPFCVRLR
ncbi:MAG: hypothetical protein PHF10_04365 [Patescibacteria group bacterium]|nr:hypothetical protein [Patescibacteria group bacterium]MDD5534955.1 hypothetical protein [Patescibacteria group bacterium]